MWLSIRNITLIIAYSAIYTLLIVTYHSESVFDFIISTFLRNFLFIFSPDRP